MNSTNAKGLYVLFYTWGDRHANGPELLGYDISATIVGTVDHLGRLVAVPAEARVSKIDDSPPIALKLHNGFVVAVPLIESPPGFLVLPQHGLMFGGAFVYSPDARFRDLVNDLLGHRFYGAVPLHDRREG